MSFLLRHANYQNDVRRQFQTQWHTGRQRWIQGGAQLPSIRWLRNLKAFWKKAHTISSDKNPSTRDHSCALLALAVCELDLNSPVTAPSGVVLIGRHRRGIAHREGFYPVGRSSFSDQIGLHGVGPEP